MNICKAILCVVTGLFFVKLFKYDKEPWCPRLSSNNYIWNNDEVKKYNNCYAYAFRNLDFNRKSKPQPGFKAGFLPLSKNEYTCKNFIKRVIADYPSAMYIGKDMEQCENCDFAVFLALDNTGEYRDYHFYRLNSDGLWTHKPGALEVHNVDYSGNLIRNPKYADRRSNKYNYSTDCGFFCVPP